ncbi:LysE/ArgO family amino acid transporter [Actinomyces culturomici]|uniref:LysE/ArgO family amino acid transporter n=1 Tax=Actinomyces culturomici TaxID=1926276 RepID=UPI000E20B5D8|nr:LysE/ArgO family amino acid transporter [Actinomyces culturomici]
MTLDPHAYLTGLSIGLGLIVAIGAQNAWVIRQGIRRDRIGVVVAVCIACDLALIAAGTAGIGAVTRAAPWLLAVLKWGGVAYLLWFARGSAKSALSSTASLKDAAPASSRGTVLLTTLGVSLLNPHVYLDTVLMLGTVTNSFGALKWMAAAGAMTASILWFSGIGWGARAASGLLDRPSTWRALDGLVALVMIGVAASLALSPAG